MEHVQANSINIYLSNNMDLSIQIHTFFHVFIILSCTEIIVLHITCNISYFTVTWFKEHFFECLRKTNMINSWSRNSHHSNVKMKINVSRNRISELIGCQSTTELMMLLALKGLWSVRRSLCWYVGFYLSLSCLLHI